MSGTTATSSLAYSHKNTGTFGPYRLGRTIGEGEFGKVKLGYHITTGEEVAIKFIKKESVTTTEKRFKLQREISILRTVSHPNLVHLIEVIENDTHIGMVLEYASGGELFEYILSRQNLSEKEAAKFFFQLIDGVSFLHHNGYVHRDLKLENLLLDKNRNMIITDFGFANFYQPMGDRILSTSCGSPVYAAPELVVNDEYIGELADIWSCGVILYAMVCGSLPFDDDPENEDGENMAQLYKHIYESELTFPVKLSAECKHLLRRILNTNPNERATMQEIKSHKWLQPYWNMFTPLPEHTGPLLPAEFGVQEVPSSPIPINGVHQHEVPEEPVEFDEDLSVVNLEEEDIPTISYSLHDMMVLEEEPEPVIVETMDVQPSNNPLETAVEVNKESQQSEEIPEMTVAVETDDLVPELPKDIKSKVSFVSGKSNASMNSISTTDTVKHSPAVTQSEVNYGRPKQPTSRNSVQLDSKRTKFQEEAKRAQSMDHRPIFSTDYANRNSKSYSRSESKSLSHYGSMESIRSIKYHSGPIDQRALTTLPPSKLLTLVVQVLQQMNLDVAMTDNPYKLSVLKHADVHEPKKKSGSPFTNMMLKLRYIRQFGLQYNRGFDGTSTLPPILNQNRKEATTDLKFFVMIHRIKNLEGLLIVDLKRASGDIWEFKRLYHSVIAKLDLTGEFGDMV
ncbi:hypothetical protein HDV04_003642 [Boothiomyces sp. JEL0838]|nr:hypothetical protein HDV04_003642 [Boothiomyces sp. JEL0838]